MQNVLGLVEKTVEGSQFARGVAAAESGATDFDQFDCFSRMPEIMVLSISQNDVGANSVEHWKIWLSQKLGSDIASLGTGLFGLLLKYGHHVVVDGLQSERAIVERYCAQRLVQLCNA